MRVTGHKLKESIKFHALRLKAAISQFDDSLYTFDETPAEDRPGNIDNTIWQAERAIARLQTAQCWYNINTTLEDFDEPITLQEAIKLIGGAGRRESRWSNAAQPKQRSRYYSGEVPTLQADTKVASRTISFDASLAKATGSAKYASRMRSAIAMANMTILDIPDKFLQDGDVI